MPTIKLNVSAKKWPKLLATLVCEAGKMEMTYWDADLTGFGLRTRSNGVRTWICWYRTKAGEQRKHTFGDPEKISLAKAREKADQLLTRAKLGGDPAGEEVAKRAEAAAAIPFGEVVEQYLERQQKRMKPRSHAEIVRYLRVDAKPLHTYRLDQVTQVMVADLLDSIADRAPVAANRVRTSLSALFSWAMKRGKAAANPVSLTDKPSTENSRDRVLSDAELSLVWRCANRAADFDRIVKLLVLTGARCQEIGGMRWNEITRHNDGTATFLLPSERAKNGRAHELVLPAMASSLLPPRRDERALIFGVGSGPFSGWSNCKTRLDERIAEANGGKPIAPWRLHDIRRTAATRMSDIGIEPHTVEAILNHVSGTKASVAGIYNRSAYSEQKRDALVRWCEYIAQITGDGGAPDNVVPMRRRA